MSLIDGLISRMRITLVGSYLDIILFYRSRFSNYLYVAINMKLKKFPIKVKLRNKEKKLILKRRQMIPLLYGLDYDEETDIVSLDRIGYPVKLFSFIENGGLGPVFITKDYDFLKVKDKTVIDIGANIADTSIYFASEGATHVIALEPFPRNYQIAKKNIELNNLNTKITLLKAGGGAEDKEIFINSDYTGVCKPVEASSTGEKVNIISLSTLVNRFDLDSACLKLDCEGCEYDAILNTSNDILRKFSRIQIEYHYGYKDICKKLKECGFKVNVSRPIHNKNVHAEEKDMYIGFIYASQD